MCSHTSASGVLQPLNHTPYVAGITILRPGQRWKALVLALVAAGVLLGGGVAVGYASSRSKATTGQQPAAQTQKQSTAIQLPVPESAAARQLLADPTTPGETGGVGQWDVAAGEVGGAFIDTHAASQHSFLCRRQQDRQFLLY